MAKINNGFLKRISLPLWTGVVFACSLFSLVPPAFSASWETPVEEPPPVPKVADSPAGMPTNSVDRSQLIYIREFRVLGNHQLSRAEVEKAVYPFMGPERSPDDVEQARSALEKAFQDKGFQTVNVQIPQQTGKRGIVFLQVTEAKVGRLNVEGARYFSLNSIKKQVPSLQQGSVPDFNKVSKEILALNQWSDRQVIPTITPGFEPGTVDVDLKVKDTLPWHGSAEFNNRYSYGTPMYRLNLASSYDNLWQLGHSIGASYQTAPDEPSVIQNWNAFYTARFPTVDWLRLNVSYGSQNSTSTLPSSGSGSGASLGNGNTAGFRFLSALPSESFFSQSCSAGIDFKHNNQITSVSPVAGGANLNTQQALDYWPVRLNYNAVWAPSNSVTLFDAGLSFGFRGAVIQFGPGNSFGNESEISTSRSGDDGGFFVFKSDLSHTQDLPYGFQIYGKIQGQWSPEPLIYTEQFAAGGLDTCRGYLEGIVVGDSALCESVEMRSPLLLKGHAGIDEWRAYAFFDAGNVYNSYPGATNAPPSRFNLASYGFGTRLKMFHYLNGSVDLGIPLTSQPYNQNPPAVVAYSPLITFRLFGEF